MLKRYLSIAVVAVALFVIYFLFFRIPKIDSDYDLYYQKLKTHETFDSETSLFDINVEQVPTDSENFDYVVSFDNFTQKLENVKILIMDSQVINKNETYFFPSFGIISYMEYTLDKLENKDIENKVIPGVNLVKYDNKKIDDLLIYFAYKDNEIFLKIKID